MTKETDPEIKEKIERISKNNNLSDIYLKKRAEVKKDDFLGTLYSDSNDKRIKGTVLIEENRDETYWPGTRTNFEIDRDQILFRPEFVRLARKTQVFTGPNVAYRNRLTHTLDVVQMSRSVAQTHLLNVDLAEAIALGHDIGHTPFGHAGEDALNFCLYEYFLRNCLYDFFTEHNLERPLRPYIAGMTKKNEDDIRHVDQSLWLLVQKVAKLNPDSKDTEMLLLSDIQNFVMPNLIDMLLEKEILKVEENKRCYFNTPLEWKSGAIVNNQLVMESEFWIQKGSRDLFAHNIHALRVLLCDPDKEYADITRQTAYGILSHKHRGEYSGDFIMQIPRLGNVTIKKEDKTLEAFAVGLSDDICFINSDIRDASNAGILFWGDLDPLEMSHFYQLGDPKKQISDFPSSSQMLQCCEDGFFFNDSSPGHTLIDSINKVRDIIKERVHSKLTPRQESARRIIRDLFWFFCEQPKEEQLRSVEKKAIKKYKEFEAKRRKYKFSVVRIVTDYIAWLTDDEAMGIHAALFAPQHDSWERYFFDIETDD